jgi:hypothetical protein
MYAKTQKNYAAHLFSFDLLELNESSNFGKFLKLLLLLYFEAISAKLCPHSFSQSAKVKTTGS